MYLTTHRYHDEDDENVYIEKDTQCMICLEACTDSEKVIKMARLLRSLFFVQPCSCNGYFHFDCLLKWLHVTRSCPICRSLINIKVNKTMQLKHYNKSQLFRLFMFTFNLVPRLYTWFWIYWATKFIYHIILILCYSVERQLE